MKKTKRILTCLLAVLMLVSSLVLSSFASEGGVEEGAGIPDYKDVLKFYDPLYSKLYDDESFDDGVYGGSIMLMESAKPYTVAEVCGTEDKYLAIKLGHILNPDARTNAAYAVDFDGASLSKVVVRADISATHNDRSGKVCTSCSYSTDSLAAVLCPLCGSELATVSSKAPTVVVAIAEGAGVGAPLLAFNFADGCVSYYDGASTSYVDGLVINEGSWYSVEVVCDSTQYKFEITDGENVYSAEAVNSPAYSITSVNIGARYVDDPRESVVMLDDVFVQAGIDDRNTGVDLYAETNEGLALIDSLLRDATVSAEIKNDVISVYDALTGVYADKLAVNTEGEALLAAVRVAMVDFFAEQLKLATDAIDVNAAYSARLALIDENAVYADRIADMIASTPSDEAADLLLIYNNEKAALQLLAENSESFIAYIAEQMADDPALFATNDYSDLKAFVDATDAIYKGADGNVTYSSTYPTIKDALASYLVVETRLYSNLAKSEAFCEDVAKAKLGEEDLLKAEADRVLSDEEFMACLAAYGEASNAMFTDTSYPNVALALSDYESLVNIKNISTVAERFISNVETAKQAIYIFQKESWLDNAHPDYESADNRYPGVREAKELYDALRADIADQKAAADAYIAAVSALDGKTGDELIAAIDAALALKVKGDVQGYPGVTEANIALDNIHKSQQLEVAYAEKFITLVANIKDAVTLEERFVAISLASEARGFASDKINGVAAANAELVAAMSLYDADIAAINASYESVVSNAGDLAAAATSLTDMIKLVASAIKAIEE